MDIQNSIEELLYRYNCVVVPGFGAFLTQVKSAVINGPAHAFYPPSKVISFNEQLTSNDGLLVSYMAENEKTSYDEMLKQVIAHGEIWKKQLRDGDRLSMKNIGELWLNKESKVQFQPSHKVNYLTSSFGLSSFTSQPIQREVLKEEVTELEEKIPFIFTPEKRKEPSLRPYFKYAAVILLAASLGFGGYRLYDGNEKNTAFVREHAQEQVSKTIQEATFFNKIPLELPSLTLEVVKKSTGMHQIIAGAFRIQENADKKVRELQQKGYNASYVGANKYGLHMVAYDSFDSAEKALEFLREIKRTESSEAWMLSVK